jgi:hypothetical protein
LVNNILNYIKKAKNPIIDSFALKLYKGLKGNCCGRINESSKYITILSTDYEKTKNDIIKIVRDCDLSNHRIDSNNFIDKDEILYTYYDIKLINNEDNTIFNLINIINVKNECLSIQESKGNGYTLGSLDSILYYLYATYIYYTIYTSDASISVEKLYYINEFESYIKNNIHNNILKRLKSNCYGTINYGDDIKDVWRRKLTLKYIT